jgi:Tol biopolymer transport system component
MNAKHQQLLRRASPLVLSLVLAAALLVVVRSALAVPRLGSLARVTTASDANRASKRPSLSGDGTVVAFQSDSDLLNEGRSDGVYEIWLYDTATMTFTRVTTASHGGRDSFDPSLDRDGTVVAFESDSDLLNEGRPGGVDEIWLYDTATLTFTRVTSASHANRDSYDPSLSGDGTVVAFNSDSDLLNEGRPGGVDEIWLYDTATLTFTRVTSASDPANRYSEDPSLSGDGTVVAFHSDSDLLNEGIAVDQYEIWLWEESEGTYLPLVLRQYP